MRVSFIIIIIIPSNYKSETKETSYLLFALVGERKCFVHTLNNLWCKWCEVEGQLWYKLLRLNTWSTSMD